METIEDLAQSLRDAWTVLRTHATPGGVSAVDGLELFGPVSSARIQVIYYGDDALRFGVSVDIPELESQTELDQFMEGLFHDLTEEPNDTTRGVWADGVWWWAPGTTPMEPPRTGGIVLVERGEWAWVEEQYN